MSTALDTATAIHRLSATPVVQRVAVTHDGLTALSSAMRKLAEVIPRDDEFWNVIDRRLRRIRFDMLTSGVPFNDVSLAVLPRLETVEHDLVAMSETYPALAGAAHSVLFRFRLLASSDDNPLLDNVVSVAEAFQPRTMAVLTRSTRTAQATRALLSARLPHLSELAVGHGVEVERVLDLTVCLGPFRWFPPSVIEAPTSLATVSVCFAQIAERDLEDRRLPGSLREARRLGGGGPESHEAYVIAPDEALPITSWDWVDRAQSDHGHPSSDEGEILARAFILAGEGAVLLEASPEATVLTLDPEATRVPDRLQRLHTDLLEEGMYLVLRTEGGGDYVAEIADRLLGERASELRAMQRRWKQPVLTMLNSEGASSVAQALTDRGAIRATEGNVRRWLSDALIRTEAKEDFIALMRLAGLGRAADDYWRAMGMIQAAHQRAGFRIRTQLLGAMATAEGEAALATGRLDLTLEHGVGGRLSAIRIEAIAPDAVVVRRNRLNRLESAEA